MHDTTTWFRLRWCILTSQISSFACQLIKYNENKEQNLVTFDLTWHGLYFCTEQSSMDISEEAVFHPHANELR